MRDPFFIPRIPALSEAVRPLAEKYGMPSLPLHIHEVVGAFALYTFIYAVVSPALSTRYFSKYYPKDSRGKKANWDSHVVSFFQSVLINFLALWVMFVDEERKSMNWQERIWGYTGGAGMIQGLVVGYFVWDLALTVLYIDVFGLGMLAHAVSALVVYSLGFRPFLNYYGCVFILYELSTPFLNIHWFCDKLNLTGSKIQLYNGLTLLATFFGCRLIWGTGQSVRVYYDMWRAVWSAPDAKYSAALAANSSLADPNRNTMAFSANAGPIPAWLPGIYVAANLTLNSLNWYWYWKMIAAVRKRFETPKTKVPVEAAAKGTSTGASGDNTASLRKRAHSIEDILPDSDELREGTIQ